MERIAVNFYEKTGINEFLLNNPGMVLAPSRNSEIVVKGIFKFFAAPLNGMEIEDSYYLRIVISKKFPKTIPKVFELEEKIKREPDNHINGDGSLCLGSPLRIMMHIAQQPTLEGFVRKLIVPYLYTTSLRIRTGAKLLFGELKHEGAGLFQDYREIFGLRTSMQIRMALSQLGLKKRLANKRPCPCGCGLRLGKCKYRFYLNKFRYLTSLGWYREQMRKI